ncbi:MAG: FkbM family methyltransferase [Bacteroidales bacterium]
MKFLRRFLYKKMGLKRYLRFISKWYIRLIDMGFFKKKHPEIHHLPEIITPGDICIDIGANLAYYTVFMAKMTGSSGKIYAVEPVPLFREIWEENVNRKHLRNVEMLPYALGETEKTVDMGMPAPDGIVHHGMTKIIQDDNKAFQKHFEAEMKIPDKLFSDISRIDFIKIDIEGYEYPVLKNMVQTIRKHQPRLQIEMSKDRDKIFTLLENENYLPFILVRNILVPAGNEAKQHHKHDFYFLPQNR